MSRALMSVPSQVCAIIECHYSASAEKRASFVSNTTMVLPQYRHKNAAVKEH